VLLVELDAMILVQDMVWSMLFESAANRDAKILKHTNPHTHTLSRYQWQNLVLGASNGGIETVLE